MKERGIKDLGENTNAPSMLAAPGPGTQERIDTTKQMLMKQP